MKGNGGFVDELGDLLALQYPLYYLKLYHFPQLLCFAHNKARLILTTLTV